MLSSFSVLIVLFHFVSVPVVNMRKFPDSSSEIVSQAYFSEEVTILEEQATWVKIETAVDHYQGWVERVSLCQREDRFLEGRSSEAVVQVNRCKAHVYDVADTVYGPILSLPFESLLEVVEQESETSRWIKVALPDQQVVFIQRGDVTFDRQLLCLEQLPSFSLKFEGLPYTWGGRSSFGYDCSGFVQMLYRQMGVYLPRDSKDQVKWEGFRQIAVEALSPGDLIFFGVDESSIRHVGMYLGNDQFIHATVAENAPYIHISQLSDPEWNGSGKWTFRAARTLQSS